MPKWFRWDGTALILRITAQPGAKRTEISGVQGEALKIRLHAPPVDGKANRCLAEFLADAFATSPSAVSVLRGAAARSKTVRVDRPRRIPANLAALGLVQEKNSIGISLKSARNSRRSVFCT